MTNPLAAARGAVFGFFGINGATLAVWVAYIPAVKHRLGLDAAALGWVLLTVAAGALVAMQLAGRLIDRTGSVWVTAIAGAALPVSLLGPALATSTVALMCACFLVGASNGTMDVAMNARAVEVERAYGRPTMSAFHAMYSIGGMVGAGAGALFLAAGWPVYAALPTVAGVLIILVLVCAQQLLSSRSTVPSGRTEPAAAPVGRTRRRVPLMATLLGLLAFSGMVVEGAAADWSGVHLGEVIGVRGGVLALGYVGFSAAMAVGRLFGDRLVQRIGPVHVVRWGGAMAVAGLVLVVTGFGAMAVIAGWLLAGVGVSGVSPQIFTAAGNLDPGSSGAALARAATLGYFGFLAGPPLIGMAASLTNLSTALVIPGVLALVVAAAARIVRRPSPENSVIPQPDSARTG